MLHALMPVQRTGINRLILTGFLAIGFPVLIAGLLFIVLAFIDLMT